MKIKNKLTIIFTGIIALILLALNFYIYALSSSIARADFYEQLHSRAFVAANIYLENDENTDANIIKFRNKYLRTLPQEIIRIYNKDNQPVFVDSSDRLTFQPWIINKIRRDKEFRFEINNRQIVGINYDDNQGDFIIIASAVDEIGQTKLMQLRKVLTAGFLFCIVVVFFIGRYFTKLMLKPVSDISDQANNITETNLHLRLNIGNSKDEIAELAITFNKMLERLENSFDLQKEFVSNASHELRTPLTSIIGNIEVTLSMSRSEKEHREVLYSILQESERLQNLSNGLLSLAQSDLDFQKVSKDEIRIDELLLEIKDEIAAKYPDRIVELQFDQMPDKEEELTILGEHNLLETALLNLVDNACKFSKDKPITIKLIVNHQQIRITISDQGVGIPVEEIIKIRETFFRATNARSFPGTGIGLALADRIIRLHGGVLSIKSELNFGTDVIVTFPIMKTL